MRKEKAIIASTRKGLALGRKLASKYGCDMRIPESLTADEDETVYFKETIPALLQEIVPVYTVLIMVMPLSTAVRSLAPLLCGQAKDTTVIVIDEEGRFVLNLLAEDWEIANRLVQDLATQLGGTAVITTTSDLNNLPGLEAIARKYDLEIEQPELIPKYTRGIGNGDPVVIWDQWGIEEYWPENIRIVRGAHPRLTEAEKMVLVIGYQEFPPVAPEVGLLALRPVCLTVGINFEPGIAGVRITGAVRRYFRERHWSTRSIKTIAVPAGLEAEPGAREVCHDFGAVMAVFKIEDLQPVLPGWDPNAAQTDMESICEPVAILGAKQGKLIGPGMNLGKVAVAVALGLNHTE